MAHYLDPKNDLTFKRVFGEHNHLCMSLINSILPFECPIACVEYQTGELISVERIRQNLDLQTGHVVKWRIGNEPCENVKSKK